jgi:hypothetical protein
MLGLGFLKKKKKPRVKVKKAGKKKEKSNFPLPAFYVGHKSHAIRSRRCPSHKVSQKQQPWCAIRGQG